MIDAKSDPLNGVRGNAGHMARITPQRFLLPPLAKGRAGVGSAV